LATALKPDVLNTDFGYVIMAAGLIAFQVIFTGVGVSSIRSKLFNKKYFEDFEGFKNRFPQFKTFPTNGYPDMGTGRFF